MIGADAGQLWLSACVACGAMFRDSPERSDVCPFGHDTGGVKPYYQDDQQEMHHGA